MESGVALKEFVGAGTAIVPAGLVNITIKTPAPATTFDICLFMRGQLSVVQFDAASLFVYRTGAVVGELRDVSEVHLFLSVFSRTAERKSTFESKNLCFRLPRAIPVIYSVRSHYVQ
jgi:hypothetical protein